MYIYKINKLNLSTVTLSQASLGVGERKEP